AFLYVTALSRRRYAALTTVHWSVWSSQYAGEWHAGLSYDNEQVRHSVHGPSIFIELHRCTAGSAAISFCLARGDCLPKGFNSKFAERYCFGERCHRTRRIAERRHHS